MINRDEFLRGLKTAMNLDLGNATLILEADAEAIRDRAQGYLPAGAMRDSVDVATGRDELGRYVDVGVLPGSGRVTESGTPVEDAALPLEFGHVEDGGGYVEPHAFMRPAIAEVVR